MSECQGKFEIVYSRKLNEAIVRPKPHSKCDEDADWRLTYIEGYGNPVNCCMSCMKDASILAIMYSCVRLNVPKKKRKEGRVT